MIADAGVMAKHNPDPRAAWAMAQAEGGGRASDGADITRRARGLVSVLILVVQVCTYQTARGAGAKAALGRPAQMGEASERSVLNGSSS